MIKLKTLFSFGKKISSGFGLIWGYVSKYITPSLLILCILLSYLLHSSWTNNTELKLRADSDKVVIEQYETRVGQLKEEIESLKLYIKEKSDSTKQLTKDRKSIEDRWDALLDDSEQLSATSEENTNEIQETRSGGDNSIDLSEHFRLLDEAYCLTTPAC